MTDKSLEPILEKQPNEEVLSPDYYVEDLDPKGAFINPLTIIERQVKEIREAVRFRLFREESSK